MAFHDSDLRIALSRVPQADYQTATSGASTAFQQIIATNPDGAKWNRTAKKMSNKGHSTGKRWATESHVESWDTELGYQFEASAQNLGQHLLAAMGSVTETEPTTDYFKHAHAPLNFLTSMQAPSYTFVEKLNEGNSGINDAYPSAVLESLELNGDGTGRIVGNANWRGSGERASASGVTWASHVVTAEGNQNYFYNTQTEINIGTFPSMGSSAAMDCDLEKWRFAIKNTFANDAGYRPGCPRYATSGDPESGVLRSENLLVDQEFEFDFTIRLQASDPRRAHFEAQTKLEGNITITGSEVSTGNPYKLVITFYLLKYSAHVKETKDGIVLIKITPEIMYSNTDSKIVAVDLYNNIESYTA